MNNCVFCQVVSKELSSITLYEDDDVIAFLDIKPICPGHTLVVSKKHFKDFVDTPDEILHSTISAAKKIGKKMLSAGIGEAVTFTFNNGRAAGQVVDHVHLHIMPRFENDSYELWHEKGYAEGEAEKIAEKIKVS